MEDQIIVNGIKYRRVLADGEPQRAVVVVDRGWIFAGDVTEKDGRIYLSRALHVFKWSSVGFAKVVEDPKAAGADIRHISDVDIPADAEIFRMPVGSQWGLSCAK